MGFSIGLNIANGEERSVPFSPLSLFPSVWLDASNAASVIVIGSVVTTWVDLSGNGNGVAQSTSADRPTLVTNVQNGRNVVRCNGTATFLTKQFSSAMAQPFTYYAVVCPRGFPGNNPTCLDGFSQNDGRIYTAAGASPQTINMYAGATMAPTLSMAIGTFYTVQATFNATSSTASLNGGAKQTGSAGSSSLGGLSIGGQTTGQLGQYDYAEVLIFPRILSSGDEASLFSYLRSKWANY